jgi:hypothetical protein
MIKPDTDMAASEPILATVEINLEAAAKHIGRSARSVVDCDRPPALASMCLKKAAELGNSGDAAWLDAARLRRCIRRVNQEVMSPCVNSMRWNSMR